VLWGKSYMRGYIDPVMRAGAVGGTFSVGEIWAPADGVVAGAMGVGIPTDGTGVCAPASPFVTSAAGRRTANAA